MDGALSAPILRQTLDRLLARERSRRRTAALRRTLAATASAALLVAAWRIFDRIMGREPLPVTWAAAQVALVFVAGLVFAVRAATSRSETEMAREVDRRLGLDDRASSALALVRRSAASRLAGFVVDDVEMALRAAASRVDAAFPTRPERLTSAWTRWTTRVAIVVVALAFVAELLVVGGPIHILPGVSLGGDGGKRTDSPAATAPPRGAESKPAKGDEPAKEPHPETKHEPPRSPSPQGSVHVAMKMSKDEFEADEPILATVSATATGEIVGARVFDVRVVVDDVDVDAGAEMRLDPTLPEGDRAAIDLRRVPGLNIEPGEHTARARLTTRTTHEEHDSAPVKFRVRAPKDDQSKKPNDKNSPPKPPPPKPKPPDPRPGDPPKKDAPPPALAAPPPPPPATVKSVVTPLFGEGEEVKKHGLVLVLDPGGGIEAPPTRRPLDDALPGAKRRAEEAVDRASVRDEDRELVRRYFELLESLRR